MTERRKLSPGKREPKERKDLSQRQKPTTSPMMKKEMIGMKKDKDKRGGRNMNEINKHEESQFQTHTTIDINKQLREINKNSGSQLSVIHGGTLGQEINFHRPHKPGQDYQLKRRDKVAIPQHRGIKKGLQQPKKVNIVKNPLSKLANDELEDGPQVKKQQSKSQGRSAPATHVNTKDKKDLVVSSQQRLMSIVNRDLKNVASPSDQGAILGPGTRNTSGSPQRVVSFSPKTAGGSGSKSRDRSKSNERGGTSIPRGTNFKKNLLGGPRSKFTKNAQIQRKFDQNEKDFPLFEKLEHPSDYIPVSQPKTKSKSIPSQVRPKTSQPKAVDRSYIGERLGSSGSRKKSQETSLPRKPDSKPAIKNVSPAPLNIHIKNARLGSSAVRKPKPQEKPKAPPYSKKEIRDMYDAKRRKSGAVQHGQTVSRSPKKDLSEVYDGKARRMQARLKEQVEKHSIVPGGVNLKARPLPRDIHAKEEDKEQISFVESEPLDLDLIPDREHRSLKKEKPKLDERPTDYARSKVAVEHRITDELQDEVGAADEEKMDLIRELNRKLIELDALNEQNREANAELIRQIKFSRDLQASLGTSNNGPLNDIIDKEMEQDLRREKEKQLQLREQIKQCQVEREMLEDQIRLLESDKVVTVVNGRELAKVEMSIADMNNYRERVIMDLEGISRDIDLIKGDDGALDHHVQALQQKIDEVLADRKAIADQLRALQRQYDDVIAQNGERLTRLGFDFRVHHRRNLAKVVYHSLERMILLHKRGYFQEILRNQRGEDGQIAAILAFRNICYNYTERRQRKYIQRWFERALKPLDTKNNNNLITEFQRRNEFLLRFLTKWHDQKQIKETRTSYRRLIANNMRHSFENYNLRQFRCVFDHWRTCTVAHKKGRDRLIKFVRQRIWARAQEAICKWKHFCVELDHQILLNSEAVRFTQCHFLQSLFYAWRSEARLLKTLRISLLLRTWKALHKNKDRRKLQKLQVMNLLKIEGETQEHLLKMCFNALKISTEQDKHQKVHSRLHGEELAQIEADTETIATTRQRVKVTQARRGITKGVCEPLNRYIHSYFAHWKNSNRFFKVAVNEKVKSLIIKAYKNRVADSFEAWKKKAAKKKRKKRKMMSESIESHNDAMQEEIKKVSDDIAVQEVRSIKKGNLKFKKMFKKVIDDELRFALRRWKHMLDTKKDTAKKLESTVLIKMKKRLYEEAFQKYRNQVKRDIQQERNIARAKELGHKFWMNRVRKIWNTWEAMRNIKQKATKSFKKVLTRLNNNFYKSAFDQWVKFKEKENRRRLRKRQKIVTEETQGTIDAEGETENVIFEQEKREKELVSSTRSLGKKTLKKVISQWKKAQTYEAFVLWRQFKNKKKAAVTGLSSTIFKRMYYSRQRDAFCRWRRNMHLMIESDREFSIKDEKDKEREQADRIGGSKIRIAQIKEGAEHTKNDLLEEQNYCRKLIKNLMEKLIRDKEKNFVVSQKAHVFDVWRQLGEKRAKALKNLQRNLIKNCQQAGLDALCVADYNYKKESNTTKRLKKMALAFQNNKARLALDRWKFIYFEHTMDRLKQFDENNFHSGENSNITRRNIIDKRVRILFKCTQSKTLKFCFIALYDYRCKKQFQKQQLSQFHELQKQVKLRRAIQSWCLRSDQTIIFRKKVTLLQKYFGANRKGRGFLGLKIWWHQIRNLKRLLKQAETNVFEENRRYAWEQLCQKANLRQNQRVHEQSEGTIQSLNILQKIDHKLLKKSFDKFLEKGRQKVAKQLKMRQIFTKALNIQRRGIFEKWKRNASLLETVRYCNEEGYMRLETDEIKRKNQNLRLMLKDKMIMDDNQIDDILKDHEEKYKLRVNQSLSRIQMFRDGENKINDNWLLPYCFDQLKKFIKKKKEAQKNLRKLEKFLEKGGTSDLANAFDQWKHVTQKRNKMLWGQTQQELFDRTAHQQKILDAQGDELEDNQEQLGDLQHQREYLIEKVVLSQRLALARCRFSYKFALEQAWVMLSNNSNKTMKRDFHNDITGTMNAIGEAKEKMVQLQSENEEIAEQNEGLREGAMEGVENLKKLEKAQEEVQTLNEQLMEQAQKIKDLLAENKKLQRKVEKAELNAAEKDY